MSDDNVGSTPDAGSAPGSPPLSAPLAPPLISAPDPVILPPYAAAPPSATGLPPYAAPAQPHGPASPYAAAPLAPSQPTTPSWVPAAAIGAFVIILLIAVGAIAAFFDAADDASPFEQPQDYGWEFDDDDGDVVDVDGEELPDSTILETHLDDTIEKYKAARDDGSLWEQLPKTEFNETAVTAFLLLLADMKAATIWGVDESTEAEYLSRAFTLEALLLAEEPLGDDIEITFSDDRVFRYDGETGEGGYFSE